MALVTDYDFELDGVLICSGADTTQKELVSSKLFGMDGVRSSDKVRGQRDGLYPGIDYYAGRVIELEIEVWGNDTASFRTEYLALMSALRLRRTEVLLKVKLPGWPDLRVSCRPRRVAGPTIDQTFNLSKANVTVQLDASDPRIYADTQSSGTATLTGSTSGLVFPATFNMTFGGITTSSVVIASNTGNYETPWTATINGPVTNPYIEHIEQGKLLRFTGSLASGESLVVSSPPSGAVLLGGTSSRYSWLQDASQWFLLDPGLNSVRLGGSSAGAPTMDLVWRSAWV